MTEQDHYADILTRLQNELPALSSNSEHITVEGATHYTLVSEQTHAAVMSDAILKVVEMARVVQPGQVATGSMPPDTRGTTLPTPASAR